MPTRKRITSKEENSRTWSISIVLVIRSMAVPTKAKLSRNSQKKRVPSIDDENIETDIAWLTLIPDFAEINQRPEDIASKEENFKIVFFI